MVWVPTHRLDQGKIKGWIVKETRADKMIPHFIPDIPYSHGIHSLCDSASTPGLALLEHESLGRRVSKILRKKNADKATNQHTPNSSGEDILVTSDGENENKTKANSQGMKLDRTTPANFEMLTTAREHWHH